MKKIQIEKKLRLNKKTVVTLNKAQMEEAKGGKVPFTNPLLCLVTRPDSGCIVTLDIGYCAYTVHEKCETGDLFC